ncbi:MAG: PepSY domain-containing protein, partial [Prevotellaceae bacterium]|nr:PepSY domain-containing protein [Prevotellaceae bacterium]
GNVRATDHYSFDSTGHHVTEEKLYASAERGQRIRGWIYSVHTGRWGGWPMRILQFFAALFGTSLPLSGYYLWWKRTRKRKARK